MKQTLSLLLAVLALAIGGCRDWFPPIDPTDPKPPGDTVRPDPNDDGSARLLAGGRWCLIGIEGSGVQETIGQIPPRYIEFDAAGKASGHGGFNQFGAAYTAKNGTIEITDMVQTKVYGDQIENQFFAFLNAADRYSISTNGGQLKLYSSSSAGTLLFERCNGTDPNPGRQQIPLGEEFKLPFQDGVEITGAEPGMIVSFESLNGDSRCPANVDCMWEGDASITVSVRTGNTVATGELHTNTTVGPRKVQIGNYDVELVELYPAPPPAGGVDPSQYIAVLRVTNH